MKKEYLVEITYSQSGDREVITLKTDDLSWSMTQYQRNRLPLTWEMIDDKDFDATNPGVWCHSLHDLMDREKFTDWGKYGLDKVLE